jgi:NADH-quinone oxidoreductase subunit H
MIEFLVNSGWNPHLATFVALLLGVVVCASFGLVWFTLIGLWSERKFSARLQDRMGPNRVGPFGLFQVFADLGKMITKEDITPEGADKIPYNIAPLLMIMGVILIWAVVPFANGLIGADLNVGALYFVSVASFGTLAVLLAGWSSNNKYSLLGALRAVAALVSYEVPMILSILVPVLLAGSMSMQGIVEAQNIWYIFAVPISAFVFFTSNLAETGRSPFDLIEAESELVAGYNIEYTGMKFGMFQAAEFVHSYTSCALMAVLFVGGWRGPGAEVGGLVGALAGFGYFFGKSMVIYLILMWVRYTVPRIRIDQMMSFNWKFLVPLQMVSVLVVALLAKVFQPNYNAAEEVVKAGGAIGTFYQLFGPRFIAEIPRTIALLLANIGILAGVGLMIQNAIRKERAAAEANRADRTPPPFTRQPIGNPVSGD